METLPVHAMKAYREVEVQFHSFLPSELHAGEWSARGPGGFTPEGGPGTHRTGDLSGPQSFIGRFGEEQIPCPY